MSGVADLMLNMAASQEEAAIDACARAIRHMREACDRADRDIKGATADAAVRQTMNSIGSGFHAAQMDLQSAISRLSDAHAVRVGALTKKEGQ